MPKRTTFHVICIITTCFAPLACDFGELCPLVPSTASVESNADTTITTGDPYVPGALPITSFDLDRCEQDAPLKLRIVAPTTPGTYSVVVLQHAFEITNHSYDQIAAHIASHGFVVILPRMYDAGIGPLIGMPTAAIETERAAVVLSWIPTRFDRLPGIELNNARVGLAGHSRGGKVAFGVAKAGATRVAALVGIDPVDGTGGPGGNQPRVVDGQFDFDIPTLILGAGLGGPCAPEGDNYQTFYDACPSPSTLVIATDYGHGDMLDAETAALAAGVCASNSDREPMRRLTAGLLVAFFRAQLQGEPQAWDELDAVLLPTSVTLERK
ncbi:MAG: dienelactone hydrolase family protein [Phycisphaerales bacterium]|nr:dienelactone hydrolase family protein [Phycisphaerales bacterium]MCB9856597.1 dienelactone hydrolase family protein [Phycisphaerales bacterium]MCB9864606.1 dienelactone hydrolase family protein [Phycisphaerales bacterium]